MFKALLLLSVLIALGVGAWFFIVKETVPTTVKPEANNIVSDVVQEPENQETSNSDELIRREPSSSDYKVYINQDWRFSFEYPVEWEVQEHTFYNKASMFNASLWPVEEKANFPDPVSINITPKWWIERLLTEIEQQQNNPASVKVDDQMAIVGSFISHSVIEAKQYLILVNDEYWIDLSGKMKAGDVPGYAEELEIVRSSFKFHEPLPRLQELDVEPYMPIHIQEDT